MTKPRVKVFVSMKHGAFGWYEADKWKLGFLMKSLWGQQWVIEVFR